MSRLFENRITEEGREAKRDLIDQVALVLKQPVNDRDDGGPAVRSHGWVPALISYLSGENEESLSLAQSYVSQSKEVFGENSTEVAYGLVVMNLNYRALKRSKDLAATEQQSNSVKNQIGDAPTIVTMLKALHDLAVEYQRCDDLKSKQRAFTIGMIALSLLKLVHDTFPQPALMEHFFRLFQSLGFPGNRWEWLMRRCRLHLTDFVGLISVLIDEGLIPSERTKMPDLSKFDANDVKVMKKYEIVRVMEKPGEPAGFSEDFLVSVAEGELSMRVERLLEEGYHCLKTFGGFSAVVLLFSSHSMRRRITVLELGAWSEEKAALFDETVRRTLMENGADSAMALIMGLDFDSDRPKEWQGLPLKPLVKQSIAVEARDRKSYLSGIQTIRLIAGEYVAEEPIVLEDENGWFSEFTFPVKPAEKSLTIGA